MSRITDYPALPAPASDDVVPVVDVSDTTQSAAGSTKQATVAQLLAAAAALLAANNLSDLQSATTARANLGLGTAATHAASDFDAAGAAAAVTLASLGAAAASALTAEISRAQAAEALALPKAGGALTGTVTSSQPIETTSFLQGLRTLINGETGASSAVRYSGATTSGKPVSGSFTIGAVVPDLTGTIWVCTATGSPGTWVEVGAASLAAAVAAAVASSAQRASNLSDLASAATARTNLGLGSAATQASSAFDAAGAASAAQSASLQKTSSLSDLGSASTARANLGLGSAATQASTAFDAAGAAAAAQAASMAAGTIISGQFLCAPKSYAPASQTALAVTATTMAAFSSGNVCTNSFTAPASGSVLVRATFVCEETTAAGKIAALGLAAAGTTTPLLGNLVTVEINAITSVVPMVAEFLVTGLTPGNTYQFDLLGAVASGNFTIVALGTQTLNLVAGGLGGPAVMTVQAV